MHQLLRALPYVKAWAAKYKDQGLVVIGVHTPEFAFERDLGNVRKAVKNLGITYPVAVDNEWAIWKAFKNNYWPAHYFIDGQGRIRYHHFGEGNYDQSEQVIQRLLIENGRRAVARDVVAVQAGGVGAASSLKDRKSGETYLGYEKAANNVNVGGWVRDRPHDYSLVATTVLNRWSIGGLWTSRAEAVALDAPGGRIAFRFHARDLHLVLGPGADGKPVRFRVRLDGQPPGADRGDDVNAAGVGVVTGQRLYQLVRQKGAIRDGPSRSNSSIPASRPSPSPSLSRVSPDQQVLVEGADRPGRMGDLDLQDPQARRRNALEIAERAGLVDGVREVADPLPFTSSSASAHRIGPLDGVAIERLAAQAIHAPAAGHVMPERPRRLRTGVHLRVRAHTKVSPASPSCPSQTTPRST